MIRNRDFIIIGLQALDSRIGSNCINIAQEIALHNRVLYVNYPLDRGTIRREKNDPLIQKRIQGLISGLASSGLVATQTSNDDLRTLLDGFLNGGRTTEFGTVMGS